MAHQVVIYSAKEKNNIVLDFYRSLPLQGRNKVLKELDKLTKYGITTANSDIKKLRGYDLWEIRIKGKESIRLILCSVKNTIYIVNIFKKKSNKTPRYELITSEKRRLLLKSSV